MLVCSTEVLCNSIVLSFKQSSSALDLSLRGFSKTRKVCSCLPPRFFSSRIIEVQTELSERAIEMLGLTERGAFILDIG